MYFLPKRFVRHLPVCGFLLILAVWIFREVLPGDMVIQSNDYNYGLMSFYKSELPGSMFQGFWREFPLLGRVGSMPPSWNMILLSLVPVDLFMDWIYPFHLLTASAFLYAFLKRKGLSRASCLCGVLTAYWLGSNLTLILPGHLEKYAVMAWASIALFFVDRLLTSPGFRNSLLLGGALGMMFMQQADLALFFGLMLGTYMLLGLLTRLPRSPRVWAVTLLPLLLPAGLMVWDAYRFSMETHVNGVPVLQSGDADAKWNFITQWSWPPAESIDLIAPGFLGWTSGHSDAPYHGVMGQSAAYAATGSGQANFKLESQYLGLLPLAMAFLGIAIAWKRSDEMNRTELRFWSCAFVLLFLLACGKFTPLYRIFVQLPLVGSIRNPNKFLQVFQVVTGILCAYGVDIWWKSVAGSRRKFILPFLCGCVAMAAALGALLTDPSDPIQRSVFQNTPWAEMAASLLANRQRAWLHLALMAAAGAGLTGFGSRKRVRQAVPWVLAGLIAVDGALLSTRYIQSFSTTFLKQNRLAAYLESHRGEGRIALLETGGIYSLYLTHLFPSRRIPYANISVAPRLQQSYQKVFSTMVPDPDGILEQHGMNELTLLQGLWIPLMRYQPFQSLDFNRIAMNQVRYWKEFGVSHVLARRSTWTFLQQWPGYAETLNEVYAYRFQPNGEEHVVLEMVHPGPRALLQGTWHTAPAEEVLTAIHAGEQPLTVGRVQDDVPAGAYPEPPGKILELFRGDRNLLLEVQVDTPQALLRLSEAYSPHLRASVDGGDPQPVLQTDLLYAGLRLPKGLHHVEFFYARDWTGPLLQWLGILISIVGLTGVPLVKGIVYVFTTRGEADPEATPNPES